ncbi:MAG: glycoside hydrolase family 1 protein, partial [Limisphaerales bacterium]
PCAKSLAIFCWQVTTFSTIGCGSDNKTKPAAMSPPSANGKPLKFPNGFLWGTATSSTQTEGYVNNEWTQFVARDGSTCRIACDSYHRYAEDIEWMTKLGVNACRMGIEWSRLQSEAGGSLNEAELSRYVDQLDRLNAAGIVPMVVLHHFSNPPWINARGGWTNPQTVSAFVDYVGKLVAVLKSRVRIWNTFNEPDTYACCGFVIGEFPPLHKWRFGAFRAVIRHMAEAHEQICHLIRRAGSGSGKVEVGFSKNWTCFQAHHNVSPWDALLAAFAHAQFNRFVLNTFLQGPRKAASTFLGVNYYGRIRFNHLKPLIPTYGFSRAQLAQMGIECDDMLERHPAGLEVVLGEMYDQYGLPIYLTEHGSSSTDEVFRERDLRENLAALHRAIDQGVDVRGFYYWSLLDNFEWSFGYSKKFGLLSVDFHDERLPRKMKPLASIYRRVCAENSLPHPTS